MELGPLGGTKATSMNVWIKIRFITIVASVSISQSFLFLLNYLDNNYYNNVMQKCELFVSCHAVLLMNAIYSIVPLAAHRAGIS